MSRVEMLKKKEWWLDEFFSLVKTELEKKSISYSKEDAEEACAELSRILDNEWFKEQGDKIRKWKIKRGYVSDEVSIGDVLGLIGHVIPEVTIYKLITLGKNIKLLGGAEKLPTSLITMMKNPREYHKAYVEIEVASCIAKNGFQVEMHPILKPFLKVPDIKAIINKKEVYIEVIVLEWSSEVQKELSKIIRPIRNELPVVPRPISPEGGPLIITAGIITTHKLSEAHGIYIGLKASPLLFIVNPAEKTTLDRLASSLSSFGKGFGDFPEKD